LALRVARRSCGSVPFEEDSLLPPNAIVPERYSPKVSLRERQCKILPNCGPTRLEGLVSHASVERGDARLVRREPTAEVDSAVAQRPRPFRDDAEPRGVPQNCG